MKYFIIRRDTVRIDESYSDSYESYVLFDIISKYGNAHEGSPEEIESRRNQNLTELGYTDNYDFDEFRDETILNEVYSVMIDMIIQKEQSVSLLTSTDLQDKS